MVFGPGLVGAQVYGRETGDHTAAAGGGPAWYCFGRLTGDQVMVLVLVV